jgi:putative DNA primase/helicase
MNDSADRYRPLTADDRKATALAETAGKAEQPTIPPPEAGSAEDAARKVFHRKPSAIWTYRDANGGPLFHVARFEDDGGKKIRPLCWTGKGWKSKAWPAPRPLYVLDKIAARPDAAIIICEGEKAADAAALIFRDFVATTSSGGAQSAAKTDWAPLAKRRVIVWPDSDEAGIGYAQEVAGRLAALGCDVSVIDAAKLAAIEPTGGSRSSPNGWDAADALAEWPDLDALRETALNLAARFEPARRGETQERMALAVLAGGDLASFVELAKADPGFPFEPSAIEELGKLAKDRRPDYERLRSRLKSETGVRVPALEAAMRAEGSNGAIGDGLPGRPIDFDEIEAWPEPVDGPELLSELARVIGRYVVMEPRQCDAVALWATHAHAHDLRDASPPLVIKSPMMRSGKTRLIETLERLVPRPLVLSGITAAFLERVIETHCPTILIDEYDALTSADPALAEAARAQLNRSSRRRGAVVGKNVPLPGGGYEARLFSTWAPTVIAGIGDPPATVIDRAIVIDLKRKLSTETVAPLRERDGADLAMLKRKIARFVADNETALRAIEPNPPLPVESDRARDMWEPLLAVADVSGGDRPERAREAGKALVDANEQGLGEGNVDVLLLSDIRDIFADEFPTDRRADREGPGRRDDGPKLATKDLLEKLHGLEERPWGAWGRAKKPMTDKALGDRLRPYGVRSRTIRIGTSTPKGYYLSAFRDAFARYLAASSLSNRHTAGKSRRKRGF